MRVIVQKYGGSSVADLERLRTVADRIAATRADGTGVVVVVSAMGNTTNELLNLARQVTERPDRRELDMLISVGERIAMALLAMALRERGIAARSLTGSQSGIITDESHADAKVIEVRPDRVRSCLEEGEVVIVAGFQGVSRHREVTTLGRGGSDTTAVVLAAALGAEYCEICSDVDGVWSADPRAVAEAARIDEMSLDEALALARGGAKVLFEDALQYARDHGVQIQASATSGPGAGTRIRVQGSPRAGATAVTGDAQLLRIALGDAPLAEVASALLAAGARVRHRIGRFLWVDTRNAHGGVDDLPGEAMVEGAAAVATAVGSGLGGQLTLVAEGEDALLGAGILVLFCAAAGDHAWWEVPVDRLDEAVRVLHQALVR
jgi:aspartate kinase